MSSARLSWVLALSLSKLDSLRIRVRGAFEQHTMLSVFAQTPQFIGVYIVQYFPGKVRHYLKTVVDQCFGQ